MLSLTHLSSLAFCKGRGKTLYILLGVLSWEPFLPTQFFPGPLKAFLLSEWHLLIASYFSSPALPFPFTSAHDPVIASPFSPQADPVSTLSVCVTEQLPCLGRFCSAKPDVIHLWYYKASWMLFLTGYFFSHENSFIKYTLRLLSHLVVPPPSFPCSVHHFVSISALSPTNSLYLQLFDMECDTWHLGLPSVPEDRGFKGNRGLQITNSNVRTANNE